ncbi:hypothetical protein RKD37_003365 [Streptomyces ambofaciens]
MSYFPLPSHRCLDSPVIQLLMAADATLVATVDYLGRVARSACHFGNGTLSFSQFVTKK